MQLHYHIFRLLFCRPPSYHLKVFYTLMWVNLIEQDGLCMRGVLQKITSSSFLFFSVCLRSSFLCGELVTTLNDDDDNDKSSLVRTSYRPQ